MNKILALIALTTVGAVALADGSLKTDKLSCRFTEPFLSVEIDFLKKTLRLENQIENEAQLYQDIQVLDDGAGMIEVSTPGNKNSGLNLKVDTKEPGSDGMSDRIFEASGYLNLGSDYTLVGGCDFI